VPPLLAFVGAVREPPAVGKRTFFAGSAGVGLQTKGSAGYFTSDLI
jgi:hypothetical protein